MNYYFKGYQFKSDQLVLLKKEQTVSLRANEAKLLTLLLSDPQRVFSKDEILKNVWAGKSVAEQSIFQNISHLRAIFGDDAITTHPKKGYQWQIPLEDAPAESVPNKTERYLRKLRIPIALVATVLILVIVAKSFFKPVGPPITIVAIMPISTILENGDNSSSPAQILFEELTGKTGITLVKAKPGSSFEALQASPELLAKNELSKNNSDLILATKIRTYESTFFISFNLLSQNNHWQGVVSARSLNEASSQLAQHVVTIVSSNILATNKDNLKRVNAQLQLLRDQVPSDMIVLQHLIKNVKDLGLLNEALLLAEQLKDIASKEKHAVDLGYAHLLISEILIQQGDFTEARKHLVLSASEFSAVESVEGAGGVAIFNAMLALLEDDYPQVKKTLLDSIEMYKSSKAYFQEFDHTISLAVYANKFNQIEDRDYYLAEAKRILDSHQFPSEHHSRIYFQQGLFAEQSGNNIEAEKYYRWVLKLFKPEQEWWHKERAQYHLSILLSRNQRFAEAADVFKDEEPLTAKENVILARVYQSWERPTESIRHAKQAYREAVLSGETDASLNAALLLIELSEFDARLKKDAYISYLKKDSTRYWIKFNKQRLEKLELYEIVAPTN